MGPILLCFADEAEADNALADVALPQSLLFANVVRVAQENFTARYPEPRRAGSGGLLPSS